MTLDELKTQLDELREHVVENTNAIIALNNAVSFCATKDDLVSFQDDVEQLYNISQTLRNSVADLSTKFSNIDHLQSLMDVSIDTIKTNDLLQYSSDGKWHNVQPDTLNISRQIDFSGLSLSQLTDVSINNPTTGQALLYNPSKNKWVNGIVEVSNNNNQNDQDLSGYLTKIEAANKYLPLTGGTINGALTVEGLTTINNNVIVDNGITMYDN